MLNDYLYHKTNYGELYCGNCIEIMQYINYNSIDMVITSPPYDNLRNYKNNCSFTWEVFEQLAKLIYQKLKNGGICVWIVGDATIKGSETGTSFKQALYFKDIGFNLHDTMIYERRNAPCSYNKRYRQFFEYMFIFSKGSPKTFNPIKVNLKTEYKFSPSATRRQKDGTTKKIEKFDLKYTIRSNIWKYSVGYMHSTKDKIAFKHPAIFPEQLIIDHIISWTNEGDLILDPMAGAGTTGVCAIETNRKYILIDIETEYCEIAKQRIEKRIEQLNIFK